MALPPTFGLSAQRAALVLVAGSAVSGVFACAFGAANWGFLGLSVGLAGAWALFLLGLFGLYQRERQLERLAARPAAAAPLSERPLAPTPVDPGL